MGSLTWVGGYLVLCRLLQMVLELTNSQFILLFLIGTAIIFIVTSLTHTHDIDAGEVAIKGVDRIEEEMSEILEESGEIKEDASLQQGKSGYKAPEGF